MLTMRFALAFSLAMLLGAAPVYATTQIIFSGNSDNLNASTTEYAGFIGSQENGWNSTNTRNLQKVSTDGNLTNLRVVLTAAPGAGTSHTLTLFLNGGATTLGCTIADTATSCQDTDSVAVTGGDDISMRSTHSTTPAVSDAWWSVEFQSTTDNESLLGGNTASATSTSKMTPLYGTTDGEATSTDVEMVVPTSGTLKNLYCDPDDDPGVGNTHICTVLVDGSASLLTCTVIAGSTNCSNTLTSVSVSAGQTIVLNDVSTASDAHEVDAGVTFVSDTAGQHLIGFSSDAAPSNTATNYTFLAAGDAAYSATETDFRTLGQVGSLSGLVLDALYVELETAPGAGNSYAITVYQNGSPTGLSCTVSETDVACNNSTNVTIANDDQYSIEVVPTSTPDATNLRFGVLVSPAAAAARRLWLVN